MYYSFNNTMYFTKSIAFTDGDRRPHSGEVKPIWFFTEDGV